MESSDGARILTDLLIKDTSALSGYNSLVSTVVGRLETAGALRIYGRLESLITNALSSSHPDPSIAALLTEFTDRMKPAEAAQILVTAFQRHDDAHLSDKLPYDNLMPWRPG
jgi:hypothetical protein